MVKKPEDKKNKEDWARLTVSSLEADVAYFDARLAMLERQRDSYYQLAQAKAYSELERVLSELLVKLQGRSTPSAGTGIEVEEG